MGLVNLRFRVNSRFQLPHVQMEYSQITPKVFIGTNQCCQAHYKLLLLDKGVNHDVSLEGEQVDSPYGAESYLWLPTEDHLAPSLRSLAIGCRHIDQVLSLGGKVYVHCKNGHGRAPSLVAAWLISNGKSLEVALEIIQTKRKEVHFEKSQIAALRSFAKRYR